MFTGIVRERGRVAGIDGGDTGVRLRITAPATAAGVGSSATKDADVRDASSAPPASNLANRSRVISCTLPLRLFAGNARCITRK